MDVKIILAALDEKIAAWQQARQAIVRAHQIQNPKSTRDWDRDYAQPIVDGAIAETTGRRKRGLTPEGRQRIREAMHRRWAKQKESKPDKYQPETDPLALRNF